MLAIALCLSCASLDTDSISELSYISDTPQVVERDIDGTVFDLVPSYNPPKVFAQVNVVDPDVYTEYEYERSAPHSLTPK